MREVVDSVAPEVQHDLLAARRRSARRPARARSRPPPRPSSRTRGCGWRALPNSSVKYGSIASSTRGSTGVVEWLSMKMGSLMAMSLTLDESLRRGSAVRRRRGRGDCTWALVEFDGPARRRQPSRYASCLEIALELRQLARSARGSRAAVGEHLAHALHRQRRDARLLAHAGSSSWSSCSEKPTSCSF